MKDLELDLAEQIDRWTNMLSKVYNMDYYNAWHRVAWRFIKGQKTYLEESDVEEIIAEKILNAMDTGDFWLL